MKPRRTSHRGSVLASGFAIDPAVIGVAAARRRVLALWSPATTVIETEGVLVISGLPRARVRADRAPGAPLVEQHGVLSAAPLEADEATAWPPGAIVVVRHGEAIAATLERRVDVAAWIDLGEVAVALVDDLAPAPVRASAPAAPVAVDVRQIAGLPAPSAEMVALRDEIAAARATPAASGSPSPWNRLRRWLAHWFAPRPATLPAITSGSEQPVGPPARSWLDRLRDRIAEALWTSRLGDTLGRRHAEYLRNMLAMFDRGELDAALRHAIPIDGTADAEARRLALTPPSPRRDLRLSMAQQGGGTTIPVAEAATDLIRERYRAALARLEQLGRIEDAAFVLADLLQDVGGAVALLERHERFELAARLAEGRGLEPGLVVRLWFLAGDTERAVDLARRHGAWADAIARLERSSDVRGKALRMRWALQLSHAGDYVQAVDVGWPVLRGVAALMEWIDRGIAADGTARARLLIKKLIEAPATYPAVAPLVLDVLDDPDPDAGWTRLALIETLVAAPTSPELRAIARASVRALLRDLGRGADGDAPTLLPRLVRFADDAALRADQPVIAATPRTPSLSDRGAPEIRRWPAGDAGTLAVHDAAELPGGRLLVALGELGVRMIGRDGRVVAQVDQPATRLVVSDHGTRALALVRRGRVHRIARLDLVERRGSYWCDAECDGGADTYDGDLWLTARGGEVVAVDTTASRWKAIWGVDTDTPAATVRRDGASFAILSRHPASRELWCYEGFTLRHRREIADVPGNLLVARPATHDVVQSSQVAPGPGRVLAFEADGRVGVVARDRGDGITITATHLTRQLELARLELDGSRAVHLRLADLAITVCDDRGRVIVLDLRSGAWRRDLRVDV